MTLIPTHAYVSLLCVILTSSLLNFSFIKNISDQESMTITTTNFTNQGGLAVPTSDIVTRNVPNIVKSIGSNLAEHYATIKYINNFKESSQASTISNAVYTFEKPVTYPMELTVLDTQPNSTKKIM